MYNGDPQAADNGRHLILMFQVGGQLCGLRVYAVRDVLGPQSMTQIPLATSEIAGNLNLRGRIVTAIDLRRRLGQTGPTDARSNMAIVIDHGQELYAVLVDRVLDVVSVADRELLTLPPTLGANWARFGTGVYKLAEGLLVMLDVKAILDIMPKAA